MKTVRIIIALVLTLTLITTMTIAPRGATILLLGDADGDGEVCITDATMIQRDGAKLTVIDNDYRRSADVDSDGVLTIMDATNIQRWLVHFGVTYLIGEPINNSVSTEEKETVQVIPLTEAHSVTRNNKAVTVDGIDFNISKIPDAITLDDSSGNTASFMLCNKALSNPADVHIEIVSNSNVIQIDYSDKRFKET